MAGMKCPKCGSTNFKSCQLIYESGTRTRSFSSSTGYTSSGTNSTKLAQSVAPPYPEEEYWGSVIFFGAIFVFFIYNLFFTDELNIIYYKFFCENDGRISNFGIGLMLFSFVIAIKNLIISVNAEKYNNEVYPKEYEEWQNTYVCMKCGNRFIF